MRAPHMRRPRRALVPAALLALATLTASVNVALASTAVPAADEAAAVLQAVAGQDDNDIAALQAALGADSSAAGVVAAPTETVDEVATWFDGPSVAAARAAIVRVAPVGRGLLVDDAAARVATVATGVLVKAGLNDTRRFVLTTWRAVNPGFANYSLAFVDGSTAPARLLRYDLGRPVAVLVTDGPLPARFVGADINAGMEGVQVGDPTLAVGLVPELTPPGASPPSPDAWTEYVGYAYDLRAPLPLVMGSPSPLRNVRAFVARSLLTRPTLAASAALFDAAGRVVGLDLEADLAAAGAGARRPEVHTLPGPYLADAVREARVRLADGALHRGDVGAALTLVPVGAAEQYYGLPKAVGTASTPTDADTVDGGGTAPKLIKVVGVDVASPAEGLLRAGDILLSVDGGPLLEDDMLAFERALTAALVADAAAVVTLSRDGKIKDVAVPVADLETMHTRRVMTWAGCTFQEVPVAVRRKYQQPGTNAVLVTTCAGAADAEAAAEQEAKVAAARATAFAKPVAGPSGGVGGTLTDPLAAASSSSAATGTGNEPARTKSDAPQATENDDDSMLLAALGGVAPTGVPAAPSPVLATLMRSRDVQAPVTPTLVTAVGGAPVTSLAQLAAAAKAAPASTTLSFAGIHSGKFSFAMVDTMELGTSPAGVREYVYNEAALQWGPVGAAGAATADAVAADPALAPPASASDALPSDTSDIVQRPAKRRTAADAAKAAGSGGAAPKPRVTRSSATTAAPAPAAADGMPAASKAARQLRPVAADEVVADMVMAAGEDDYDDDVSPSSSSSSSPSSSSSSPDLVQAAVDSDNEGIAAEVADAASSPDRPAPASVAAWLALAAHARGRVPVHASQTWSAAQIAAFKKQAVTITIYEWFPLEHNTAASKATGSGFVVDSAKGIIATNAHVAGATVGGWEVLFFDGSTAPARPIWFSPQEDIAFLKVDPASIPYPDAVAPLASWTTFAADHAVADGDFAPVLSVGSPGSFAFATMQGVYLGESYRATDDIGGLRARNYIKIKTLIQSAGGASGGPVFNANGSIVGIHFAGGTSDDPRFKNTPYWRESLEVAADYLIDALKDGVSDLKWPTRGGLGLELDLVPIDDAVKFFGMPPTAAAALRADVAAANAAAAPRPPTAPRPRDRVIVVTGYEPGAPTVGAVKSMIAPGDIIYALGDVPLAGDLLTLERALHKNVNGTVPLTTIRYGAQRSVDAPVYDLTADRVTRFAVWNGAVLHDVSDRTRFVYRYANDGVFVAHRADGSSWPRYRHTARPSKMTTMQAKYVVTAIGSAPTPSLDAMIGVACAMAGGPDVPTAVTARDLQSDDYPGGEAWEMWIRSGLDPLRVYTWSQAKLAWVLEKEPCVRGGGGR